MLIRILRNSPLCLAHTCFVRQMIIIILYCIYIYIYTHVYLYVPIKCICIIQLSFLLVKQIFLRDLPELNRPMGVLAPGQVWEPLPWINLNPPFSSFSPLPGTAEPYGAQSVSPTTVFPLPAQFRAFHNGSILITHTGTARAQGFCCVQCRRLEPRCMFNWERSCSSP